MVGKMKQVHKIAEKEYILDSAAFVVNSDYYISDRENENEEPSVKISLIKYKGKAQFRLAISGNFHKEKLKYFSKNPEEWKEKIWICIDINEAKEIAEFINVSSEAKEYIWDEK